MGQRKGGRRENIEPSYLPHNSHHADSSVERTNSNQSQEKSSGNYQPPTPHKKEIDSPLKTKQQTIQTKIRNNGREHRRKKNANGVPATNAQKKIVAPEALPQGKGGRHRRYTMTTTTARAWSAPTTATANTAATNTSLGTHEKRRRKKWQCSKTGRTGMLLLNVEERPIYNTKPTST